MFIHWSQIKKGRLVCSSSELKLSDIWVEAHSFTSRFLCVDETHYVPLSAATCETDSLIRLTINADELKGQLKNLPSPEGSADDDRVMVNYTSMIQSATTTTQPKAGWISAQQICDGSVESSTGRLGAVRDLVFDAKTWGLKYLLCEDAMVKDRMILIDPEWIEQVDLNSKTFQVGLSREILVLEAVFDSRRVGNAKYEIDV